MSIRNYIYDHYPESKRRGRLRQHTELYRGRKGESHIVFYSHHVDDPCSYLLAPFLKGLLEIYGIEPEPHLVPAPDQITAPEMDKFKACSLPDARLWARRYRLNFSPQDWQISDAKTGVAPSKPEDESWWDMAGTNLQDFPALGLWACRIFGLVFVISGENIVFGFLRMS